MRKKGGKEEKRRRVEKRGKMEEKRAKWGLRGEVRRRGGGRERGKRGGS